MALRFLRRYQRKILIAVAIVIIPAFVLLWGGEQRGGGGAARAGAVGTINDDPVGTDEYRSFRTRMQRIGYRVGEVGRVLQQMALVREAEAVGVEASDYELRRSMRGRVKLMAGLKPTEPLPAKLYRKTLRDYRISEIAFQQAAREAILTAKLSGSIAEGAVVSVEDRFIAYCAQNAKLRVLYKDFPVADYRKDVEKPSEEKIKERYNKSKDRDYGDPLALYAPERAALEVLFAAYADFEKRVKVTDEDLKKHYGRTKYRYKIDEPAATGGGEGETDGGDDKPTYKPLAEVKKEVAEQFRQWEGRRLARKACEDAKKEHDAEKPNDADAPPKNADDAEAPQKDADDEKQPREPPVRVDLKALAERFKLTWERIGPRTAEGLRGDEGIAPFGSLRSLAYTAFDKDRRPELTEGLSDVKFVGAPKGTGALLFRVAQFHEAKKWTLEQARAAIVERIVKEEAEKLVEEKAQAFREKLDERDEDNKPTVDLKTLTDTGLVGPSDANARPFHTARFGGYKPVGATEIIRPYAQDEDKKVIRVGVLVARTNPTREAFKKDAAAQASDPPWQKASRRGRRAQAWELLEFNRKYPITVVPEAQAP